MALLAISVAIEVAQIAYTMVNRPQPPRPNLASLQIANAQNGAPVPFGYGTARIAGQIIWTPGITVVQKGGGGS